MKRIAYLLVALGFISTFTTCQTSTTDTSNTDTLTKEYILSNAPLIPAEHSISKMTIEDGFEVQLIASEPYVSAPVAMRFDKRNRMWVIEMQNYMPDLEGEGEDEPTGKIVILEDTNSDGIVDDRKVFLDSLILPRALCLIENGILVVEPPKLWYYEIINDKPGKRTLVDADYTQGSTNVEGMANGLYRAMDNWIYNSGSDKRYRKKGDRWLTERTHLRGQWSISQDDEGRLYYNNNSQNLLGDYFLPGLGASNTNVQRVKGFSERIVPDNRVYPGRPTPGVNRGYKEGILDDSLRLKAFTSASGPVIYRGDLFGKVYYGNAFVPEPAAHLIKRNIIHQNGNIISGEQAYEGKEFLTSIDERFRPVTAYNGPDGALYILDMYRGIIEHKAFMTEYLKKQIQKRNLDKIITCGRIYKIVPKGKTAKPVIIPDQPDKLVDLLRHPNGWIRDQVQQQIIDGKFTQVDSKLRNLLQGGNRVTITHALWTLEGLGALKADDVVKLLQNPDKKVKMQALGVLSSTVNEKNYKQYLPELKKMISDNDSVLIPYVAFQMKAIKAVDQVAANEMLLTIAEKNPNNQYVAEAVLSNMQNQEEVFLKRYTSRSSQKSLMAERFTQALADIKSNLKNRDINQLRKQYPRGASLYFSSCQACHGADGNGVQSLAPPVNHSEWVTGSKEKLTAIVLFGLTGPIKVNNKLYKAPEISGDMPGLADNPDILDEDIAQLLSFIRNAWGNTAEQISREEVIKIRKKYSGRKTPFTVEELDKMN
ncbi:MAG TPA: c-type cytochrome [Sphingobacteriaceae bacterium]